MRTVLHCQRERLTDPTVAVRGETVVAVWPGYVDRVVGIAVDIGSTTIAGHLCDLLTGEILSSAGRMNPQIRIGIKYQLLEIGNAIGEYGIDEDD